MMKSLKQTQDGHGLADESMGLTEIKGITSRNKNIMVYQDANSKR